jgi:hypothetical protein
MENCGSSFRVFRVFRDDKSKAASDVEELVPIPGHDDERRSAMLVVAQFGAPAYMRRAKRVETAFSDLIARLRVRREELLGGVRQRLRLLLDVAGSLEAVRPILSEHQFGTFCRLITDFGLTEREPTSTSPRRLRRALHELDVSVTRFNRRWLAYISETDLSEVNAERDGYNRWYQLEKECAVGIIRSRQDFKPLEPITIADVLRELPPLPSFVA